MNRSSVSKSRSQASISGKSGKKTSVQIPMLVGRKQEKDLIRSCLLANRNLLIEGPVGVGKTHLVLSVIQELGLPVFRIDGDSRYSEQKLTGWFDPPSVIRKGFNATSFFPGPLVEAMQKGGVLFINELNRLPEGVQNVLLPAVDERLVIVPKLGEVRAKPGFRVIATQNPKEFVATSHLSEAVLDRFELVVLPYQSEEEEVEILKGRLPSEESLTLIAVAVKVVRKTRVDPKVRRGASVRAAMSIADIGQRLVEFDGSGSQEKLVAAIKDAALLALPTRIEIERDVDSRLSLREELKKLIDRWVDEAFSELADSKKKEN